MDLITTNELLTVIIINDGKFIEAGLWLGYHEELPGNVYSTHFIRYNCRQLFDEGCDGEVRRTSLVKFYDLYQDRSWRLDCISD